MVNMPKARPGKRKSREDQLWHCQPCGPATFLVTPFHPCHINQLRPCVRKPAGEGFCCLQPRTPSDSVWGQSRGKQCSDQSFGIMWRGGQGYSAKAPACSGNGNDTPKGRVQWTSEPKLCNQSEGGGSNPMLTPTSGVLLRPDKMQACRRPLPKPG